ncbi:hypothetical protein NDI76_17585 [Halogeometricum sp. S1BR25-6]|uniref:Uncharacterized protein n=1 Tax=Halogeometricum salsisoli TaxID=2950536 RepID=A0ABU2GIC2_9EURY|nr:hypothetical protein [Halogeometricum sp. S1BR25-6]MDS0300565.1 hypothetical protein [Halogeometricum sp. S1BR25-6]
MISGDLAWLVNPWIRWGWISLAGIFGGFLGWFNIFITFPEVDGEPVDVKPWEWAGIGATVGLCALLWVLYHPWFSVLDARRPSSSLSWPVSAPSSWPSAGRRSGNRGFRRRSARVRPSGR